MTHSTTRTLAQHEIIEQYTGVGSGVLKSGTLLDLGDRDQYEGPADVVGTIDRPGTWVIRKASEQ